MVKVNYILDAKNIGENYFDILNYKILKADHKHQRNGMTAMLLIWGKWKNIKIANNLPKSSQTAKMF